MKKTMSNEKKEALDIVLNTIKQCKKKYWEFTEAFNIFKPVPFNDGREIPLSSDGEKLYFSPKKVMRDYDRDQYETLSYELIHVLLHMIFDDPEEYRNTVSKKLHNAYTDIRIDIIQYDLEISNEDSEQGMLWGFGSKPALRNYFAFCRFIDGKEKLPDTFFELKREKKMCRKLINYQNRIGDLYERDDHELWLKQPGKAIRMKWNKVREDLGLVKKDGEEFGLVKKDGKEHGIGEGLNTEVCGNRGNRKNYSDRKKIMELLEEGGGYERSEEYGYGYGRQSGNNADKYKAADEKGRDYTDIIRDFFRESEGQREDPETIDRMMYSYGFELYDDVALIEPSEETEKMKIGTVAVAIDTSGSCSGPIAGRFLREISNIFKDILRTGEFEQIVFYQCDCEIQQKKIINDPSDMDFDSGEIELFGFGGTSFVPVFEDIDEMIRKEGKKVDALFYMTDGCGNYPEKKPSYETFFIIPEDQVSDFCTEIPEWINRLSIKEEKALW